jgi:hypothetical protein
LKHMLFNDEIVELEEIMNMDPNSFDTNGFTVKEFRIEKQIDKLINEIKNENQNTGNQSTEGN